MKKKLLLLSAKYFDVPFVHAAHNLGYYVVTTGNKADQPAHYYSDEYIPYNYMDLDGMVDLVVDNKIDAVCQGCTTDACALSAAYIGEKLNMKGHDSYEVTQIIHHKDKFKAFANLNNIRTPKTQCFESVENALHVVDDIMWPVIVKPVDLGGGQGISVAKNETEFKKSVELAFNKSIIGHIVVEPYIEGTLHSMSTFLVNEKVVAYGTADDYSFLNPYRTNTGLFPASKSEVTDYILIVEVEKIAKMLHLTNGLLHFQYIVDKDNNPWIIEMMRRSPGNRFLSALSNSTGINWIEWIIRAEAGENCEFIPKSHKSDKYYGYHSVMANNNGIFKRINIDPIFEKNCFSLEVFSDENVIITDYMNEKLGSIQYCFSSELEKEHFLPQINQLIYAEIM